MSLTLLSPLALPLPLVLASSSPRRQEILRLVGYDFTTVAPRVDETLDLCFPCSEETATAAIKKLALRKAEHVYLEKQKSCICLGADTVIYFQGKILGKPADSAHAAQMLHELSGQKHLVITGVAIIAPSKIDSFAVCSEVEFYDLSESQIAAYVATGSPLDKAGSYGVQDQGALLIKHLSGDFYGVMGLPIAAVHHHLSQLL